jgi:hypothetical protein
MTTPARERNFIGQKVNEVELAQKMGFGYLESYREWIAFKNSKSADEQIAILVVDKFKLQEQLSAIIQHVIHLESEIEKLKATPQGD